MKKLIYLGMGLALCMGLALFTGCEEKEKETGSGGTEGEVTDLRILDDTVDNVLSVLDLGLTRRGIFRLKNTGSNIVAWEIPALSEEWLSFSKQSGKLEPGATDRVELTIDESKLPLEANEAVVYIGSTVGTMQFKIKSFKFMSVVGESYVETASGMELKMVAVEGGTFMMGATSEQGSDYENNEKPVHEVTLNGFYIGETELTNAQWRAVMGTDPSNYKDDKRPVECVSWDDAVQFCEKLSQMTGRTYRLPTEAEWEYAARGGQQADGTKYAGSDNVDEVAWYITMNTNPTYQVGEKKPNGLGLYDMSGNVGEWCQDWDGSYSSSSAVNPQGPAWGSFRVCRGGNWGDLESECRVSARQSHTPDTRGDYLGFRVVCER